MEKSKNYNFNLPNSENDEIADINLISENFAKIDSELSEMIKGKGVDQSFSPTSKNPQSGVAISGELSKYLELNDDIVFVFSGGDAESKANVDLVIDNALSETSQNPISNEAVTKEFKKYTPTDEADEKYLSVEDYDLDKKEIADYVVEQRQTGGWNYRKWNSGSVERTMARNFFNANNPNVLAFAKQLTQSGFDGITVIQVGKGADAPTTYSLGLIISNGVDRCQVVLFGSDAIYINLNVFNAPDYNWEGWRKLSGTAL